MKKVLFIIPMIFGFAFFVIGQPPVLPSQPQHRVGVSYDNFNSEFSVSHTSLKRKRIILRSELGLAIFNLRDKHMQYEKIENYYTIQKTYRSTGICLLCWFWGGSSGSERGPDKVLIGDTVNVYNGFYPKVAIPMSYAIGVRSNGDKRFVVSWGGGVGMTFVKGLKVSSKVEEIKLLDDKQYAEIVRMKQTVHTRKHSAIVFGVFADWSVDVRMGKSYYLGVAAKYGANMEPVESSVEYASFKLYFARPSFTLSKVF